VAATATAVAARVLAVAARVMAARGWVGGERASALDRLHTRPIAEILPC
jgi:hypothetical protein